MEVQTYASFVGTYTQDANGLPCRTPAAGMKLRKLRSLVSDLRAPGRYRELRREPRGCLREKQTWTAPRIIFGDFNEWTRGLATRSMANTFKTFEPRTMLKNARTYPGFFPILHLDHFYYESTLNLERIHLVRSREALIASDHLPLVADFSLASHSHD